MAVAVFSAILEVEHSAGDEAGWDSCQSDDLPQTKSACRPPKFAKARDLRKNVDKMGRALRNIGRNRQKKQEENGVRGLVLLRSRESGQNHRHGDQVMDYPARLPTADCFRRRFADRRGFHRR